MIEKLKASISILGLHGIPTLQVVRMKYLQLAKVHHPDIHGGDAENMKRFNQAYECIQANAHILEQENRKLEMKNTHCSTHDRFPKTPKQTDDDWIIDLRISQKELQDPSGHPNSPNNLFSYHDDLTLYRSIMMGNTSMQVARSFGYTEKDILDRVQSVQFKQRIRLTKRIERNRRNFRENVHPAN